MTMALDTQAKFIVEAAISDEEKGFVPSTWRKSSLEAGYPEDSLVEDWEHKTCDFLAAATTKNLKPKTLVARDNSGMVLGSVVCQIWSGPIPWVVQPEIFQLGTLWNLHINEHIVTSRTMRESVLCGLVRASLAHLHHVQCSRVVFLASSPVQAEELAQAKVGFGRANMLTLDLMSSFGWKNVASARFDGKYYNVGPASATHDETVCSHWRLMWEDVGIPSSALLSDMKSLTLAFLEDARKRLSYQTFLATCARTGRVVGSVSCQIWEGPSPTIVKPEIFQLGTIWAVYVDPAHRRRGVATELMKLALQHLKNVGCTSTILIAASEAGRSVYERLGFHANISLVCDLKPTLPKVREEVVEEKKHDDPNADN